MSEQDNAPMILPEAQPEVLPPGIVVSGMEEAAVQAIKTLDPGGVDPKEKLDIYLRLEQIVNGMDSILSHMDRSDQEAMSLREDLQKAYAKIDRLDAAMNSWKNNQEEWRTAIGEKTNAVDPATRNKATAKAMQDLATMTAAVKAQSDLARISFAQKIKDEPQVTVVAPGRILMIREQGQPSAHPVRTPTVISINGLTWRLPPGRPVKVPQTIADRLNDMMLEEEALEARKRLLSANNKGRFKEDVDVAVEWAAIGERYGSPADPFIPSN